ncbi:bZIP transcription factor 53-like [Andrographis paniculata]|uniref:bZIP transcription factor 53-like n=1 Tax=Andrographis paniculata TaxID=175694 RepID=UPI0021E83603|nr:bZIP transcription factor 53-like [Andrographis paniculata]
MASTQQPVSPISEIDDDKKRKRKLSNRESARRSRMRKQQHLDELVTEQSHLQEENKKLMQMIDDASQRYLDSASNNNVLRAQVMELTDRLRSLNSVIEIASEVSGLSLDIQDIPDALLEPWQLPCPTQAIPANANVFQY